MNDPLSTALVSVRSTYRGKDGTVTLARAHEVAHGSALSFDSQHPLPTSLELLLAALAADGVQPMDGFPRRGAHGQIAFLNRDPRTGVLVELCQPDAGHSPNGPHDE